MKLAFLLTLGLLVAGLATAFAEGSAGNGQVLLLQKHVGKGMDCNGCHQENPPTTAVKTSQCLTCHGTYEQLADKTDSKGAVNPHGSHQGDLGCDSCHNIHKPSVNYCSQCHDFELKVP